LDVAVTLQTNAAAKPAGQLLADASSKAAMSASSIVVTLNALRAQPPKPETT